MKLYLANGQYVGTQAEARKIDKGFEQVEVPTDKEGLIDYLNNIGQGNRHDDTIVEEIVGAKPQSMNLEEALATQRAAVDTRADCRLARLADGINVEEEIANADFPTALRLAEHATARVGEHLREIADARFPKPSHRYTKLEDILK